MEMTLSLFAWLGVILFQAMMHFYIRTRRRPDLLDEEPALEASPLVLESLAQLHADHGGSKNSSSKYCVSPDDCGEDNLSTVKTESIHSMDSSFDDEYDTSLFDIDDVSFDGDEPQMFFLLLNQTGSEMMMSCQSIEHLVREQVFGNEPSAPAICT